MASIGDTVRRQYFLRDCWKLAKACHDLTGWTMVAVGYVPDGSLDGAIGWAHVAVRLPDGRCLDMNGLHEEGDLIDLYEPFLIDDPSYPADGIEQVIELSLDQFHIVLGMDPRDVGDEVLEIARSLISTHDLYSLLPCSTQDV